MNVVVYSKPDCQQCVATVRTFKRKGVEVEVRSLQDHPEVLEFARREGWSTAPVVMVDDGTVAAWAGFNPDNIRMVATWREEQ